MNQKNLAVFTNHEQGVFTITMNRPKVNALDSQAIFEMHTAFKDAERNADVGCVLLKGEGKQFCAGQDLLEAHAAGEISYRQHLLRTYNPLILQIRRLEKPVIAAIHGSCAGAGLGFALACDLRIASESARFVVGFVEIGLVPDSAVSLLLPAMVGLGRANQLALLNTPLNADKALEWGLVNRVVADEDLADQSMDWAISLAQGPTHTLGLTKRLFNKSVLDDLERVLDYEAHMQGIAQHSQEHKERLERFLRT